MSSAVVLTRSHVDSQELSLFGGTGGEPTLNELLVDVWEGLTAQRDVACPVCGGRMGPEFGAHARPLGGRCAACGTALS